MQFFRSCFRERGSPNGEDFYPQTRRFPAAILGGLQGEATQYTDKKTAQAVCNAYENGFSGRNEMKEKGWRPFWAALLAALLVLLLAASMFPNFVVASADSVGPAIPAMSAASSELTLMWMTIITCVGLPLVLVYHVIIYRTFRGRIEDDDLAHY